MCNSQNSKKKAGVTRRDVLKYSAAAGTAIAAMGPLGSKLLPTASGAIATQPHMTIVNMFGGNDGLNMVIPVMPGVYQTYAGRRPTIAIDPQVDAVHPLDGNYVLHPQLPNIGRLYTEGDVAVMNLVGYPSPNLSHFTSEDIWSRGVRNSFPLGQQPSGWIARWAGQYEPQPTGAISVGLSRRRDFTGGTSDPLILSSASNFRFDRDGRFSNNHDYRMDIVRQVLAESGAAGSAATARNSMDQAHSLIDQTQLALTEYENFAGKATYTNDRPSRYLQDVARLIHGGFDTRIFYTGYGGFDTHGDQGAATVDPANEPRHARLLRRLDDGIASFEADMKAMGIWQNTVIAVISEFGRRCFENGSNGTDHGHGACMFLIGGAVNAGVYGPDLTSELIDENWLPPMVDFRNIFREVLEGHLGAPDTSAIFPEAPLTPYAPMGLV